MVLRYLNYDNLNIDEEIKKIRHCEEAEVVVEPKNKNCLFLLGMLFANGVRIKILNEKDLNLEETNKSFSIMPYVWSKIGDKSFPSPNYSDVRTEMDRRVENIKRLGVKVNKINNKPSDKKIFLICPVRNASPEQKKWIENYVSDMQRKGYTIHAPHLHTRQTDLFGGYAICTQNAQATASASEIDVYYDQSSTGSVFDLGVAYALQKPLKLLNEQEIKFNDNDLIDRVIKNWPFNRKIDQEELNRLKMLLALCWSKETCSPGLKDKWNEDNPSLGQCAITSLIINDIFGGQIMRCMTSSGSHYYNMVGDKRIDLTREQFLDEEPDYEHGEERTREYLLGNEDTKKRYKELLGRFRSTVIDFNMASICRDEGLYNYYDYLNKYYMFSGYDIDNYSVDGDVEHVRILLDAQTTGCFIEASHDLYTGKYDYRVDYGFMVPLGFLEAAFDYARRNKRNIALEKTLTDAHVNAPR